MGKLSKDVRMKIHNRFDIEVVDVKTGEIKQRAQALNVVCTKYFEAVLSRYGSLPVNGYQSYSSVNYRMADIVYGDGTGTPSSSDTGLFHQLGVVTYNSASHPSITSDDVNGVWSVRCAGYINYDVNVGKTITEVGFKLIPNSYTYLITHAMLQDMNGNPISILHTDTDIINVYATTYLHYEQGTNDIYLYDSTIRWGSNAISDYLGLVQSLLPRFGTYSSQGLGTLFYSAGMPYSGASGVVTVGQSNVSYDVSLKQFTKNAVRLSDANGNLGGLHYIGAYCTGESPTYTQNIIGMLLEVGGTTIPPTTITNESVGIGDGSTVKFKTAFHCPYNATVKINGVAQTSGVRVIKAPRVTNGLSSSRVDYDGTYGVLWVKRVYKDKPTMPRPFDASGGSIQTPQYFYAKECWEITAPEIGLQKFSAAISADEIFGSNDGVNWTALAAKSANANIPDAEAHYKYYYNSGTKNNMAMYYNAYDGYNIVFDTAPAQGDVITIDYTTDYIPKDADHVVDLALTFTFGEWTGE